MNKWPKRLIKNFESHISKSLSGCWEWSAYVHPLGYGKFTIEKPYINKRKTVMAHRFYWEYKNGPVPRGLELDHLCRNRKCINPAHLEAVTRSENLKRSPRWNVSTCPKGHPYTLTNTYICKRGKRSCKTCQALTIRTWWAKNKPKSGENNAIS